MITQEQIDEAVEYCKANDNNKTAAARYIVDKYGINLSPDWVRKRISDVFIRENSITNGLIKECEDNGIDPDKVNYFWHKSKKFSLNVNNKDEQDKYDSLRQSFIEDLKQFAPVYPVIERSTKQYPHLLVIDPADIHFGKYSTISETGEETTTATTKKRFNEGIDGIIETVKGYQFDKIIYVGGNDILHTDNAIGTTTGGTRQDTDRLWHENYLVAKQATIEAIDKLLTIADVHFVFCPSNHDFTNGFFLADAISSHYFNNKNISFDIRPIHRKYVQYGVSLIGFTHGDGVKELDLNDMLKTEAKAAWSLSKQAYWYVHHFHNKDKKAIKGSQKVKMEKDYRGVTIINTGLALSVEDYCYVEYVRSLSGTDRWHYTNGFVHAPKAIEAFIHCPAYGQVGRFSHLF